MSKVEIKPGNVVQLKSGNSPKMVAKFLTTGGEWLCTWFDNGAVKEHTFMAEQLIVLND